MLEGPAGSTVRSRPWGISPTSCLPYLAGHSAGLAELAGAAAERCRFGADEVTAIRRAAFVHDVGRVAVPVPIWQKRGPLTAGEWERVRLHPYHSERILSRSPFLAALAPVATAHHERLDGSGYHRGVAGASLSAAARVLAAADAYHAMTEPRPHRAGAAAGACSREPRRGGHGPDGSTPTRSARCSRRPGTRRRGSSVRRG